MEKGADIRDMERILTDENERIEDRFRVLFELKNIGTEEACNSLTKGLNDDSVLLVHEIVYVIGQMGFVSVIPILVDILCNENQNNIIRHESAEAIGALEQKSHIDTLEKFTSHPDPLIRESAILAVQRIIESGEKEKERPKNEKYTSRDPSFSKDESKSIKELEEKLTNKKISLYERYTAMFTLRNIDTPESAMVIGKALSDPSALFCHEAAFVLGQMNQPVTTSLLIEKLDDKEAEPIVRHECAFALGSIGTEDSVNCLQRNAKDTQRVVRESCLVGLDMTRK